MSCSNHVSNKENAQQAMPCKERKYRRVAATAFPFTTASSSSSSSFNMIQEGRMDNMSFINASDGDITNLNTKYDTSCFFVLTVSIIGVIGNAMTLCAFQYAKLKKKYYFHRNWKHITVFIWNLALVDLMSSVNMTIMYVQFTFYPNSINNWILCVTEITLRDIFVLISAISLACIAAVTMMGVTRNSSWKNFCDSSFRVNALIITPWLFGFLWYIAKLIKIAEILSKTSQESTFDCGTFFYQVNLSQVTLFAEFILHVLVFFIIIVSYGFITMYSKRINSNVETSRHGVNLNETNATKVVLLVCVTYMLQCIPYMVCRVFFPESLRKGFFIQFTVLQKISYMIYYTQFFPNIFIYVTRNENYRNAYIYWIKSCLGLQFEDEMLRTQTRDNVLRNQQTRENTLKSVCLMENAYRNPRPIERRPSSV